MQIMWRVVAESFKEEFKIVSFSVNESWPGLRKESE